MSDVRNNTKTMAVRHPDVAGVATVTVAAYEDVYRFKGWVPVTVADLKSMKQEELTRIAADWGVTLAGDETPEEAVDVLMDSGALPPAPLPDNLQSMKKDELVAEVATRKLSAPEGATRDDLIKVLMDSQEAVNG